MPPVTEAYKLSQLRKHLGDVGLASADDGNWTAEIRAEKSPRHGASKPRLEVSAVFIGNVTDKCKHRCVHRPWLCSVTSITLSIVKREVCQRQ